MAYLFFPIRSPALVNFSLYSWRAWLVQLAQAPAIAATLDLQLLRNDLD
jgi:hypothetical protein